MKITTGLPEIRIVEGTSYEVALVLNFDLAKGEKLPDLSELTASLMAQLKVNPYFRLVPVPLSVPISTVVINSPCGDKWLEHTLIWREQI